jgi:predicted RNA-binding protein YlxR (DUF448 family)
MQRPLRTCIGCRLSDVKSNLVRVARAAGAEPRIDMRGTAAGRGAYLHPRRECVETAKRRRALERALRGPAPDGLWDELLKYAGEFVQAHPMA